MKLIWYATVLWTSITGMTCGQVPRQRIGLDGVIGYGSIGRANSSGGRGVRGDIIMLGCEAGPQEEITVGAYLYYRHARRGADDLLVGVGEWRGVPVRQGAMALYRSRSLGCASISTTWKNNSTDATNATIQLFIPYQVLGLSQGTYEVVYRVRAWANARLVDDFYTDTNRFVNSTGTTWYERQYVCAAASGPSICHFRLIGTDDPSDEEYYGQEPVIAE
jgi:hypothetical protein